MKNNLLVNSRYLSLLLFSYLILTISCTNNHENKKRTIDNIKETRINNKNSDSLSISVHFDDRGSTGINITNRYMEYDYLKFINHSKKDTIITQKIKKIHKKQIISFLFIDARSGDIKEIRDKYVIDESISNIEFKYNNGYLDLFTAESKPIKDNLFDLYGSILLKVIENTEDGNFGLIKSQLDSLHSFYKKKHQLEKNKTFQLLNENYYINTLQIIDPKNIKIDHFLKQGKDIISGDPINSITYLYIKNNIHELDFESLNTKNYSKEYIYLISVGMLNYLSFEDNKGEKGFQSAINWLKNTDLYKKDSIYLNKKINPIDNNTFKTKLSLLKPFNILDEKTSFANIIKQNPSKYYLIDFWATWCAPCIQGIKTMKRMNLPKNVSVISISLDKGIDKEKWVTRTKSLEQTITYMLDDRDDNVKYFLKLIELHSLPRYILMDENMNLIDQAFTHPEEPDFLSKLENIRY